MGTKAVIYARYSPRKESVKCQSVEAQLDLCRQYCKTQQYDVICEYYDKAKSGSDEERPGLWMAVNAVPRNGVLIVWQLDRLARDVRLSEYIRHELSGPRRRARVEAVTGSPNGEKPEDVMMRQILQSIHEYDRKVMAARTSAMMLAYQQQGRRMSRDAPYGQKIDPNDPKRTIPDDGEMANIGRIKELHEAGLSLRQICRAMEAEKRMIRGSPRWHFRTMSNIIKRGGF